MTTPTPTPSRRGRPPTPGGAPSAAQRSAASRIKRQVVSVELDLATMTLVDEVVQRFGFDSRVAVVRFAIQTAHKQWMAQLATRQP